jgi:hypothetical protein
MVNEPTTRGAGMILTATTTIRSAELAKACGLDGNVVPRGRQVPIDNVARCRNAAALLSSGALQWRPPAAPRPSRRSAPAAVSPTAVAPRDFVAELRAALAPLLKDGAPLDVALDRVPLDLVQRAVSQFAHRAGQGAAQRSPNGFRRHLMEAGL